MTSPGMRVVIIGAGVGGLTLALLLRRRGMVAEVVEQAPELREAGAAIALASNATRVLHHLGLGDDLARLSTEPTKVIHRDGRDGHPITAHPIGECYRSAFGAPFYGLHRAAFQQLLAGAWGPGHLHLGCQVDTLEERGEAIRVRCATGAVFDADLVVGADGVHSSVRSWVTGGHQPVYSQTSGFRGLVPAGQLPSLPDPGALQFWMGPGAHLLHYPIAGGSLINFLAVVDEPRQWTAPAWMEAAPPGAHLKSFAGWHPAVTQMLEAVPQSPRWGLFTLPPLACWGRGPVVLLGDAAHAMLPHQGQGANQAIEDAAVLAAELDGATDIPAALRRYEHRRRVRTRQVQAASWAASAALHLPDGPAAQSRNAYLAQLPGHLAWIHGHDVLAEGRASAVPAVAEEALTSSPLCRQCTRCALMPSGRIHAPDRRKGMIEDRGSQEPQHGTRTWTVMTDPEGGEFCAFLRSELPGERLHGLVVDSADPETQARWWAGVYGVSVTANDGWYTLEDVRGMPILTMDFVPVPEPKTVQNRIHWDVTAPAVTPLVEAGATVLREPGDDTRWHVLADPEGNEFCAFTG